MIKFFLIIGIVTTLIFIVCVYFDLDQSMKRELTSIDQLIYNYKYKHAIDRRVVIVLECESGLCESTLKSILDQSFRVNDIAIETNHPKLVPKKFLDIVTVHQMKTAPVRELDANTVVMYLENGKEYPYDFVERTLLAYTKGMKRVQ